MSYIKYGIPKRLRKHIIDPLLRFLLRRTELGRTIEKFAADSRELGFTESYTHYTKFVTLYLYIRLYKPSNVLELGAGVSTLIILLALQKNEWGKLTSVDESEFYGGTVERIAKEVFGSNGYFRMHIAPSTESAYRWVEGTAYESLPVSWYDFVYVDGPTTKTVDLDVFGVLEDNPNAKVLIDCRGATVEALREFYPSTRFNYLTNIGTVNV